MNRDDIIRLARQAGLHYFYDSEGHCGGITTDKIEGDENDAALVAMLAPFVKLVAATERERCAWVAQNGYASNARDIAAAIRARGNT